MPAPHAALPLLPAAMPQLPLCLLHLELRAAHQAAARTRAPQLAALRQCCCQPAAPACLPMPANPPACAAILDAKCSHRCRWILEPIAAPPSQRRYDHADAANAARPIDLRAFATRPIRRLAWGWELERAGCLRGWGFMVRTGCVGGLDCVYEYVSCVSDGLCNCSLVALVVLCVCVPRSKICVSNPFRPFPSSPHH